MRHRLTKFGNEALARTDPERFTERFDALALASGQGNIHAAHSQGLSAYLARTLAATDPLQAAKLAERFGFDLDPFLVTTLAENPALDLSGVPVTSTLAEILRQATVRRLTQLAARDPESALDEAATSFEEATFSEEEFARLISQAAVGDPVATAETINAHLASGTALPSIRFYPKSNYITLWETFSPAARATFARSPAFVAFLSAQDSEAAFTIVDSLRPDDQGAALVALAREVPIQTLEALSQGRYSGVEMGRARFTDLLLNEAEMEDLFADIDVIPPVVARDVLRRIYPTDEISEKARHEAELRIKRAISIQQMQTDPN